MAKTNTQTTEASEAPKVDEARAKLLAIAGDTTKNVSVRIRELDAGGLKKGEIQKILTEAGYKTKNGSPIRFQHVRNVLITPAKKPG